LKSLTVNHAGDASGDNPGHNSGESPGDSPKRIGILIPSSNTVLEPLAANMVSNIESTVHFSRLQVIDVTLSQQSCAQFTMEKQIDAAKLLCDAGVDSLVWGGTSASWLGADHDARLCDLLEKATGVASGSCILEMNRLFDACNAKTFGLVTPYTSDVQKRIIKNYTSMGFTCSAEQHYGGVISSEYAAIEESVIAQMVRNVAQKNPSIIFIMCTNMRGARVSEELSDELGIPVFDSATVTLQAGLRLANGLV
jgi:maleate isomerase